MDGHELGLVLAEQQSAILLLLSRAQSMVPVDQDQQPAQRNDREVAALAIFAHLGVLQNVVCAAPCSAEASAMLKVALKLVSTQLLSAVAEQRASGGVLAFATLSASLPVLFAAETRVIGEAMLFGELDLGRRAAEHFTDLASSENLETVWAALVASAS
jgi:hypothetical protein